MKLALEIITLQTPRGRLLFFGVATALLLVLPFGWPPHLSLWHELGWNWMPSIGLTRAYWLLIHGHPSQAWDRNWLIFPVVAVWLVLTAKDAKALMLQSGHGTKLH